MAGASVSQSRRLMGGDLSDIWAVELANGERLVAKSGARVSAEGDMLEALARAGTPVPAVHAQSGELLLMELLPESGGWSERAWRELGGALARQHAETGDRYGWHEGYGFGSVELNNGRRKSWVAFWGENRLVETARPLGEPWTRRVEVLVSHLSDILPDDPPAALLHGDLWSGNILVAEGRLSGLVDPACYYGHSEVDLAMLNLFGSPGPAFLENYGTLAPGWADRCAAYQLFPALVHLRLFGAGYARMADRLLVSLGA